LAPNYNEWQSAWKSPESTLAQIRVRNLEHYQSGYRLLIILSRGACRRAPTATGSRLLIALNILIKEISVPKDRQSVQYVTHVQCRSSFHDRVWRDSDLTVADLSHSWRYIVPADQYTVHPPLSSNEGSALIHCAARTLSFKR
jgi:hypothetical protein